MVTIYTNWVDISQPRDEWIHQGPGLRAFRPQKAFCADDNRCLPLSVIPLQYRHNNLSKFLIALQQYKYPWNYSYSEHPKLYEWNPPTAKMDKIDNMKSHEASYLWNIEPLSIFGVDYVLVSNVPKTTDMEELTQSIEDENSFVLVVGKNFGGDSNQLLDTLSEYYPSEDISTDFTTNYTNGDGNSVAKLQFSLLDTSNMVIVILSELDSIESTPDNRVITHWVELFMITSIQIETVIDDIGMSAISVYKEYFGK